jgi:hypothetical protein
MLSAMDRFPQTKAAAVIAVAFKKVLREAALIKIALQ